MSKQKSDQAAPPARTAAAISNPVLRGALGCALDHLGPRVDALFDDVDDALFDMAEKADSNAAQTRYFDDMRDIRKHRRVARRQFRRHLEAAFVSLAQGEPLGDPDQDLEVELGEEELALVPDEDLEKRLALSSMSARADQRNRAQLRPLERRLGVLVGKTEVSPEDNPVAPAHLARALHQACAALQVGLDTLLVVYKLAEKRFFRDLGELYVALNTFLAEKDVLPQLTPESLLRGEVVGRGQRTQRSAAPGPADSPPAAGSESSGGPVSGATSGSDDVWQLLAARRRGGPAPAPADGTPQTSPEAAGDAPRAPSEASGTPAPSAGPPAAAQQELLQALNALQQKLVGGGSARGATELMQASAIKQQLRQALAAGPGKRQTSSDIDDTVDLVAMFFEYLVADPNLPEPIRALLARLQIPYMKLALVDRSVFTDSQHPARQLINELAAIGTAWSEVADRGGKILDSIRSTVQRIIDDFENDPQFFETVLDELADRNRERERKAAVAEKRATEITKGRERLLAARKAAAEEIAARLEKYELPDFIREILKKPWANVLVLAHLRHGRDSAEWNDALNFADDLIWTGQPKHSAADVARLQSMLPRLSQRLRAGLEMVAYHLSDIQEVFVQLKELYRSMLAEPYRDKLHMPDVRSATQLKQVTQLKPMELPALKLGGEIVEDITDDLAPQEQAAENKISRLIRQQVEELKTGTWLEFTGSDGAKVRAKLSWRSPISKKYLFVTQQGVKLADKSADDLSREIATGETLILDSSPVFERALSSIVEQLKAAREKGR